MINWLLTYIMWTRKTGVRGARGSVVGGSVAVRELLH